MYGVPSFDIASLFSLLYDGLNRATGALFSNGDLAAWWQSFYPSFRSVSTYVSLFLLLGIVYSLVRLLQIRIEEHHELKYPPTATVPPAPPMVPVEANSIPGKEKWKLVQTHLESENPSDWRLAVLEADIILDEMVRNMRPEGENLGDRLKTFNAGNFQTLDSAWEAHKIRNAIAHDGASFLLSRHEARRIIGLYEQVFREFKYI